jgi:hypothetical protein
MKSTPPLLTCSTRHSVVVCVSAAVLLGQTSVTGEVATAWAQPHGSWSKPETVSQDHFIAGPPRVAVARRGVAIVVWDHGRVTGRIARDSEDNPEAFAPARARWSRADALRAQAGVRQRRTVRASIRRVGRGSFSRPRTISPVGAWGADVGISGGGESVVTWVTTTGTVQAAIPPPRGRFRRLQSIGFNGRSSLAPQLAVGDDGTAVLVWQRMLANDRATIEASVRAPGQVFGPRVVLSQSGLLPQVAVNAHGAALVVWDAYRRESDVHAAARSPGRPFSAPIQIPNSRGANAPADVALGDDGTAIVLVNGTRDRAVVKASTYILGGTFAPAKPVTRRREQAEFGTVEVDARGNAVAAWDVFDSSNRPAGVQATTRQPGGVFAPPRLISSRRAGGPLSLAMNWRGAAVALWNDFSDGSTWLTGACRAPEGGFQTPERLARGTSRGILFATVGIDGRGEATAVWTKPSKTSLAHGIFASSRRVGS